MAESPPPSVARPVIAVILAAGLSQRFGHDNKLHAVLSDGAGVIESVIRVVSKCDFGRRLMVTTQHDPLADELCRRYGMERIDNPDPGRGIGRSIALGVASLDQQAYDGAAIFLGDMPFLKATTVARLLAVFAERSQQTRIVRPCFQGQPGHPVFFPSDYFQELSVLEGDVGARSVIRRHADCGTHLETGDPGVLRDIDRPEDL